MALRPGTTRWHCATCQKHFNTTLIHGNVVKCPDCSRTVKAQGVAHSKVQGLGSMYQQNIGLELLFDAQRPDRQNPKK